MLLGVLFKRMFCGFVDPQLSVIYLLSELLLVLGFY